MPLAPLVLAQGAGSVAGFLVLGALLSDSLWVAPALWLGLGAVTLGSLFWGWTRGRDDPARRADALLLTLSGIALGILALSTGYVLASYAAIPADIVSFAESSFVNDIIKWRAGVPLYTPAVDNSAYPYMPGTQLLTYGIASLIGDPTSIPLLRKVALSYVALAAVVAAFAGDRLLLLAVDGPVRRLRPLWWWILACVAWLAATDPRFNMFVHSLHNDGLALLVSTAAFAAVASHLHRPRAVTWVAMAVLPAAGYLVKQSLLIWSPLLAVTLLASGRVRWKPLVAMVTASMVLAAGATWYGYARWGGEDFLFWVFSSLGNKRVSPARSAEHLLLAGGYVVALLFWTRVMLAGGVTRPVRALVLATAGLFLVEAYTSGIGFTPNHLGPGVVLASLWGILAVVAAWPAADEPAGRTIRLGYGAVLAAIPVFYAGALGLVHAPRDPVPPDLARYLSAIEAEFVDQPADRVLLDHGSWPYLQSGVVMKDRADPVALHAGANQPAINRPMLAQTIARIRARSYSRILARSVETFETSYDFLHRGTGIREALLEEYQIVRRIPAVQGVRRWWPPVLLSEVAVLEPRPRSVP